MSAKAARGAASEGELWLLMLARMAEADTALSCSKLLHCRPGPSCLPFRHRPSYTSPFAYTLRRGGVHTAVARATLLCGRKLC